MSSVEETVEAGEKKPSYFRKNKIEVTRRAFSINEFCHTFGFSRSFYYKLLEAGKVRPVTILGLVTIPIEEVERFHREELGA